MAQRKYRVAGKHKVFGHAPGETFTREIPEVQEVRLLDSGAIEKVGGKPAAPSSPTPSASPEAPVGASTPTTPSAPPTPEKE